jgi:hypothetical protein
MERFDPDALAGLDEPVRRYLTHAIHPGSPLASDARLEMRGRIKVGPRAASSTRSGASATS